MWSELLTAVSLVLVIEGLLPFLSPARYRDAVTEMSRQPDTVLRLVGLSSMIGGVLLLILVR